MEASVLLNRLALVFYLASTVGFCFYLWTLRGLVLKSTVVLLLVAFLLQGAELGFRTVSTGTIPAASSFESMALFGWLLVGTFLLIQIRYPLAAVGAVVSPVAFSFALTAAAVDGASASLPRQVASAWLPVHVTLALLGIAIFFVAGCISIMYLLEVKRLKNKRSRGLIRNLPPLETLDSLNYRALLWGFPLLTLGMVTGALWGRELWGQLWSRGLSREILALVTWVLYALILEARMVAGWRGRRTARLTLVGLVFLAASYLLGHLILPGMPGATIE